MSRKELSSRAWKYLEHQVSPSAEERAALPESPVGPSMEALGEAELDLVVGGLPQDPTPI